MATIRERIGQLYGNLGRGARSSKGKDVLVYLIFVCVAFIFWLLLSLDNEVQRDFEVPLELQDLPDSVNVVSQLPPSVSVSVKGKGSQLLRFLWSRDLPTMKLKFEVQKNRPNQMFISRTKLESKLRDYFGSGSQILSCRPDSIKLTYTSSPGIRLRLKVDADIQTNFQYIISGPIRASVDSVTVYSVNPVPSSLKYVTTEPIVKAGLKDSTRYEVRIKPIEGMKMVPDKVTVLVPVEPLISKKRAIAIEVINAPEGYNLLLFPSKVTVSYLVPISEYSNDVPVKVFADFNTLKPRMAKIPLSLSASADAVRNASLSVDSVEYIIEKSVR